jgi:hypothetical protein
MEDERVDWFGIRTVLHFGRKKDGTNLFEERVCVFSGVDSDEAFEKAEKEADKYCADLDFGSVWYPEQEAYTLFWEVITEGYEVFSQVFEFDGDLDTFYEERYKRYEYTPDP